MLLLMLSNASASRRFCFDKAALDDFCSTSPPLAACRLPLPPPPDDDDEENVSHLSLQLRLALGAQVARLNDGCWKCLIEVRVEGERESRGVSARKEKRERSLDRRAMPLVPIDKEEQFQKRAPLLLLEEKSALRATSSDFGLSCSSSRRQAEDGDRPRARVGNAASRAADERSRGAAAAAAAIDDAPLCRRSVPCTTIILPAPFRAREMERHCGRTYPSCCEFKKRKKA